MAAAAAVEEAVGVVIATQAWDGLTKRLLMTQFARGISSKKNGTRPKGVTKP